MARTKAPPTEAAQAALDNALAAAIRQALVDERDPSLRKWLSGLLGRRKKCPIRTTVHNQRGAKQ
jgi:hypothetical protein